MKKVNLILAITGIILISIGIILLSTNVNAKSKYNIIDNEYIYVDEKTCNEYIIIRYNYSIFITPRYGTVGTTYYISQNNNCLKKKGKEIIR